MALRRQAISGAVWSAAETMGRQAVTFLVFILLARLLSPDDLGLFATILIFYVVMQCFVDDGIGETLVQRAVLEPAHLSTALWTNLAVAAVVAGAAAALAGGIAGTMGRPELVPLVQAEGLVLVVGSLGAVHQALLRRDLQFRTLALRTWTAILLAAGVGVGMALSGFGVWSLVGQQATERLVSTAFLWTFGGWRPRGGWSARHARELLGYTSRTVSSRFVLVANDYADQAVIAALLGTGLLGLFAIATRLFDTLIAVMILSVSSAAFSAFSRIHQDRTRLRAAFHDTLQLLALAVMPAFIGLAAVAPTLIPALFGPRWQDAAPVLAILALGGVPILIGALVGAALRAAGRPGLFLKIIALSGVATLAATLVGSAWGLVGVAAAVTLRQFLFLPWLLWLARRHVGAEPRRLLADLAPAALATAVMVAAVLAVRPALAGLPPLAALAVEVATGMGAYGTALMIAARRTVLRLLGDWLPRPAQPGRPD